MVSFENKISKCSHSFRDDDFEGIDNILEDNISYEEIQNIQDAILGNVCTMLSFALGIEDSERLSKEFTGFSKEDLSNLEK